jgi:Cyclin, N-terminal domain
VYRAHIHQSEAEDQGGESLHYRIFNDLESQQRTSSNRRLDHRRNNSALPVPSLDQITTFYRDVFQRAQMEYDCIIISLIYVERLIKTTRGALRPRACNWRSILFSCMVLSSKVWDDLSMWNADFSQTCPNGVKFPLKRINELEVAILSALSYKVKVPASEYAKYYFLLRSMLIKSGLVDEDADTTSPLDVEGAKRLQQVSTQFQSGMGATRRQMRKAKSMRSKNMVRSKSVGVGEMKSNAGTGRNQKKVNLENVVKM